MTEQSKFKTLHPGKKPARIYSGTLPVGGHRKMSSIGFWFVIGFFIQICPLVAANVTTEPSGFYKVTLLGNSDTFVSLPFARSKAACGLVQSVAGNVVTVKNSPG